MPILNITGLIYIRVKIIPWSRKSEFIWYMADWTLKFNIKEKAENFKANQGLIDFLYKQYNIQAKIIWWQTNRIKLLKII